jgi:hypothetical protein
MLSSDNGIAGLQKDRAGKSIARLCLSPNRVVLLEMLSEDDARMRTLRNLASNAFRNVRFVP